MLETIREYALERLQDSQKLALMQRHAEYFTEWVERAEAHLYGPDQAAWLTAMELDADNVRAAMNWALRTAQIEMAARMACAMAVYWRRRGYYSEGRSLLEQALPHIAPGCLPDTLRAKTLQSAGSLAYRQGDWSVAQGWLDESLALFRSCPDLPGTARVLFDLGWIAIDQANWSEATRLNLESLAAAREAGDRLGIYRALTNLGWTRLCTGEHDEAAVHFNEAYDHARRVGHTRGIAVSLVNLGWIALHQDDLGRAADQAGESLHLCHALRERECLAECLEVLAVVAVRECDYERAARLSGAAQAIWDGLDVHRSPSQHSAATHARAVALLRQHLPQAVLASAWQEGIAMSQDPEKLNANRRPLDKKAFPLSR
jgi:tetratricopeptide (TPR) repeat protein